MLKDVHEEITNKIIAKLETGTAPWQKQWKASANFEMPKNGATGQYYHGVNVLSLWMTNEEKGYDSPEWMTFNQAIEKKEQVRKGEKGSLIIFYKMLEKEKDNKIEQVPLIKSSYVFNRCQLQNYKPVEKAEKPLIQRLEHVEQYIQNTGARIYNDGGNRAYYSRATDDIHRPDPELFKDTESLYAVTMHELTHWTSKEERCNRQLGKRFGDKEYAMEELVAELGAAFNCAALEITNAPREDHAAYIENWLQVLKDDKKAIFTASSEASKAVEFMDSCQPKVA